MVYMDEGFITRFYNHGLHGWKEGISILMKEGYVHNWLQHGAYLMIKARPMCLHPLLCSFVTNSHIHIIMMPSHHTTDAHHMGKHFSLNQSTHWLMPSYHLLSSKAHICILKGIEAILLFN
jgi:hypothetical protein